MFLWPRDANPYLSPVDRRRVFASVRHEADRAWRQRLAEHPELNPWALCPCGHLWLQHDVDEYSGDGSETCCVWGCEQAGCPGRTEPSTV